MPLSGSKDIPHVRIHDHFIRKRPAQVENSASKKFKGLSCINDSKPDSLSIARAYLQQYEKFESNHSYLLDSASSYLKYNNHASIKAKFHEIILLHYLQADYPSILKLVNAIGSSFIISE